MALRLFLLLSVLFLLLTSREPPWADSHVVYDTTEQLVERAALDTRLDSGPVWFYAHRDGHRYGVFPVGNVLAMVPSYLAYKVLRKLPGIPEQPLYGMICHLSPALMMAAACVLFFWLARRRGAGPGGAALLSLGLGLGTIVFVYARSPYAEALQTVAMLWLVERTLAQAEAPTSVGLGWLAVAAGTLLNAKLVYALALPPVAAYLIYARARAGSLRGFFARVPLALLVFAELCALALWHNHLKTGSLWDSGYHYQEGVFSGDLLPALHGFFFSSGKGMFLYSPPLVLAVLGLPTAWRRRRAETVFLLSEIVVVLGFNAKFKVWHADYCWGPRYLVPITPLLLLLALPWLPEALAAGRRRLRRAAVGTLFAAGLAVQLIGASIYWDHYIRVLIAVKDQTGAAGWFQDHLSHGHFIPRFSPVRGHLWMLSHLLRQDPDLDADAPWRELVPQPANLQVNWDRLRLDWWPLEWAGGPEGSPKAAAAALAFLSAAALAAGWSLRRAHRRARSSQAGPTATAIRASDGVGAEGG